MVMPSRTAVRTNRSQVNETIVLMMAKPLAIKTTQRIRHINVNRYDTVKNFQRFRYIYCIKSQKNSVCIHSPMIFFDSEPFTSGHALFFKVFYNFPLLFRP